jgi:hypothetical protein
VVAAASSPVLASGGPAASTAYGFVAKLEIGLPGTSDARACTGALVRPRVVVTPSACLNSTVHTDPAASSALPIIARFGSGAAVRAVDVRVGVAPGLSAIVLAKPVQTAVAKLATTAAAAGDEVTAAGFGRTKDAWIVDAPHTVDFTVQTADSSTLSLTLDASADAGLCQGDAGAPLMRTASDGSLELVALATAAYQKGCLGSADTDGAAVAVPAISLAALPAATSGFFDQLTLGPVESGRAPVAGEGFGTAVATADFNKDGYLDIVVGSPTDKTGTNRDVASGTVTLFMGSANGPSAGVLVAQTALGSSDEAGDQWGASLATGDFNKDGYADLAIGVPGEQIGTIKSGSIGVLYGSSTGLINGTGISQAGLGQTNVAGDLFGSALTAGDFNGDGYADLAIGAPGKSISSVKSGQVFVLKGSSTGLLNTPNWVVDQRATDGTNEAGDLFGSALAAGNVVGAKTGTIYSDLVVGVPGESPDTDPKSGGIYVIPGSASGPVSGGLGSTQTGNGGSNEAGDLFGAALATGDFNKDGWADVVVGTPGESPGTSPQSGTLLILPGGSSDVGTGYGSEEKEFTGGADELGDKFGSHFAVGDINADGYADLVVGAPGKTGGAGAAYTLLGGAVSTARPEALVATLMIRQAAIYGTDEANDHFGSSVAMGDLNKDGKSDAIIGSPGESAPGEPNAGTVTTLSRLTGTL